MNNEQIKFNTEPLEERKLLEMECLNDIFKSPDFKRFSDSFIEERKGKISFIMTLSLFNKDIQIKTNEGEIPEVISFDEMKRSIENKVDSELKNFSKDEIGDSPEVKKFIIEFSFKKDGEEVQQGERRIIG